MTNRERVLTILRGEIPDRVPFSPNVGQWFSAKRAANALPSSLADCQDEVDVMLKLGWDIFSRRVVGCLRTVHHGVQTRSWRQDDSQLHQYITPKGTLTEESSWQADSHTTYKKRYYVRDWERDYPAFRYLVENTEYQFNEESYRVAEKRIGEAGVVIVPFAQSPIKLLHNFAGQEQATFFMLDRQAEMQELSELHTEHLRKVAEVAAKIGICDEEMVRVASRRGEVVVRAHVTEKSPLGTVFLSFHFPDQVWTNALTIDAYDPITDTAEYKACAVKVERM